MTTLTGQTDWDLVRRRYYDGFSIDELLQKFDVSRLALMSMFEKRGWVLLPSDAILRRQQIRRREMLSRIYNLLEDSIERFENRQDMTPEEDGAAANREAHTLRNLTNLFERITTLENKITKEEEKANGAGNDKSAERVRNQLAQRLTRLQDHSDRGVS